MLFRLRAFGLHLLGSATALTLVLGTLYLGWYAWPGWYLCDAKNVVIVLMGVDLALGPSLTLIIANPRKPGRVLARDVSIIVAVQLIALTYGSIQLWTGRPLYYAFSESVLQAVQAYDLAPDAVAVAEQQNSPLRPHWNSLPRWIWAPLPQDATLRKSIVKSAIGGGPDVIEMPQYFRPWQEGLEQLRQKLKPVGEVGYFTKPQKILLKERMQADGLATDQANSIPLTGRGFPPLLAVFDPKSLQFKEYVSAR